MRIRVFLASLFLIFLTLPVASAQESGSNTVQIGAVNTDGFPELSFYVTVLDSGGVPIQGLTEADFQVFADEQQAQVISVENFIEESLPISVVLAIDTSESMFGKPLDDTKAAALAFLDNLGAGDEVAIVDFDTDVVIAQEFTTDLDQARSVINDLPAGGKTALYDASFVSADLAARANTTRRFVVFLTDGNEYGGQSTNPPEAGIQKALENNISFYTIALGFGVDGEYLQAMADGTNGQFVLYPDSTQLSLLYEFLATYLRSSYIVRVGTSLEPDGAEHQLRVNVNGNDDTVALTTPDLYPQVVLNGVPADPATEPFELTYRASAVRGLGNVALTLDGQPVEVTLDPSDEENAQAGRVTIDPYTLDPTIEHTLELTVADNVGGVRNVTASLSAADLPPVFVIGGLGEAENVILPSIDLVVEVLQAQQPVSEVIYRVDGVEVGRVSAAPYAVSIDSLSLGAGQHSLEVAAVDPSGEATQTLNFAVDASLFITPTNTPTQTLPPSETPTPTFTFTPTFTNTPTPTDTPTITDTPTPSDTPTITLTPTPLAMATATSRPATNTPRPSSTPRATDTSVPPSATSTATNTESPPTNTPEPTATPTATRTVEAVAVEPTASDTVAPTDTSEPSPTPSDTPTATLTSTPVPSLTPTVTLTETLIPTVEPQSVDANGDEEDKGTITRYWPVIVGIILVIFLLLFALLTRRRNDETPPQ